MRLLMIHWWVISHVSHQSPIPQKCPKLRPKRIMVYYNLLSEKVSRRPRGLMDMASDFGSEDCGFESRRGQCFSGCNFKSIMSITSNWMGLTWTWFFIPGYSQEKIISKSICFHLFNSRVLFSTLVPHWKNATKNKVKFRATSGKIRKFPGFWNIFA